MPSAVLNTINRKSPKTTKTLSLVLTNQCNLKCSYCYENHREVISKTMEPDVAKKVVSDFLQNENQKSAGENKRLVIDFFGGEPLLAFPLIKETVEWCCSNGWENDVIFSMGTNGTLLNSEIKEWFTRYKDYFSVSLSLDGNRETHNLNRDNSYDRVFPHLDFFKENWPMQPAKMTISAATIPYLSDSVIELEEMEVNFTANLQFEDIWGDDENREKLLNIYEEQLDILADFYIKRTELMPVYPLLRIVPDYLGIPEENIVNENDCLRYCGAGHDMIVVDTDGKKYPCHRFIPWVTGKPVPDCPVNRQTAWKPAACSDCKIVTSCPTCAGFNWEVNGDSGFRTTFHCGAHKLEVLAASKIAAERLLNMPDEELETIAGDGRALINNRINALLDLIRSGI